MSNVAFKDQSNPLLKIAEVMAEITGNQLGEKQLAMIESRLKKRSLDLKLQTLDQYFEYFWKNQDSEVKALTSLLTTHHTYFFREFTHFEFLEQTALGHIIPIVRARADKTIRVWSAASSRGQEAYSLAMFLKSSLKVMAPDLNFQILGTDIDPESVSIAKNGVYTRKEIKEVPLSLLGDHWARGTGEIADFVKAKASLRDHTRWQTMNLLSIPATFTERFDIIFCRNVFIYFNQTQIKSITQNLLNRLNPEGFLFLGISESLNGLGLPISSRGPSVYSHPVVKPVAKPTPTPLAKTPPPSAAMSKPNLAPTAGPKVPTFQMPDVLRVLCVDDSPTILALMKKIFVKEEGFEVVGTAINGLDASKKLAELKPDVMTLDIHMPEQTGLEYLMKNHHAKHPPVVMVSSVSREESDLAVKALKLGASDYVEKPALNNFAEVSEELRRKIRSAFRNSAIHENAKPLSLDESFSSHVKIENPDKKARVIVAHLADKNKLRSFFIEVGSSQPPTFVFLEGSEQALSELAKEVHPSAKYVEVLSGPAKANEIYFMNFKKSYDGVMKQYASVPTSMIVCGEVSESAANKLKSWPNAHLLLEDWGAFSKKKHKLASAAKDIVPFTSFAYMSCEFLGKK